MHHSESAESSRACLIVEVSCFGLRINRTHLVRFLSDAIAMVANCLMVSNIDVQDSVPSRDAVALL